MCGIAAIYEPGAIVDEVRLSAAIDALQHRGPDGRRVWLADNGEIGLAHARLAIIGLSDQPQPVSTEDGSVRAVVNGEFYNFERIRRELEAQGDRFSTNTDSEILVHLYRRYGLGCLDYLRGEFAFVLWDARARRLFAARDRFGIKPLVYATTGGGGVALASESKALFAAGVPARWDEQSFYHAMQLQYVLPDRTLFDSVFQLKPGHYLIADHTGVRTDVYFDLDFPQADAVDTGATEEALIEEFAERLTDAVRLRLRADVPVCTHLSGGLDSASISGLAAQISSRPLHCFSVSFQHERYDELAVAQRTAQRLGAVLHPVAVSQQDILDNLADAAGFSEGLAVNGHLSAKYILHKEVRRAGFPVVLSGEGADELLAGYAHLRQDLFTADGRANLVDAVTRTNSASTGIMLRQGQCLSLAAVERKLSFVPGYLQAKGTLGFKLRSVLRSDYLSERKHTDSYADLMDEVALDAQVRGRAPVDKSTYLWMKTALANYILKTLGDGTEMAHAVEGRVPFLDHELFACARKLPISMKIRGTREKHILREGMRHVLTDEVYRREKHPFVAPPLSCFAEKGSVTMLRDVLSSAQFTEMPFFDQQKLLKILEELPAMPDDERAAFDPVFMTALSAYALHSRFNLGV